MIFSCSKGWDYVMVLAAGHWPCDHFSATRSMSALDDVAWSWLPATGRATCPGGQGVTSGKGATEHHFSAVKGALQGHLLDQGCGGGNPPPPPFGR